MTHKLPTKSHRESCGYLLTLALSTLLVACSDSAPEQQASEPALTKAAAPVADQAKSALVKAAAAITEASYRSHVATLSSDEFGGRGPASPGEEKTVAYLENTFKNLGLSPGNGDSYIQDVPLTSVEITNNPELKIQGADHTSILKFGSEQVMFSRKQGDGTTLRDSELVFVGYGINAPERNWNDYEGVDVTGKTVVMLINDPGYATQDSALFNGNAMTYYGRWDYKFDEAAKQGAAGAIIVHDTKPAAYPWSTVESSWTGPLFDIVRDDKGAGLADMEAWITMDKAVELFAQAGMDLDAMYQAARTPGFKAQTMGLRASATLTASTKTVVSKNVAAMITGTQAPDEYFIYMAHWDHLGTDPSIEGDGIYNGALDNATGTAGLLELAAAFSALPQKPARSVLFLAVTAEEQGLLGSAYYAANPLYPLAQTVAGLNMDGLNNFGRTRDVTVIGHGFSELDDALAKAADSQGRVLAADREAEKGYYFRSDHFELAKLGVPMLYPNTGYDHLEGGVAYGMEKSKEYISNHYHGVSDEYSPDWDVSGAIEDLQLFFLTGEGIANGDHWPNWNEGTEFKAIRDAQRVSVE